MRVGVIGCASRLFKSIDEAGIEVVAYGIDSGEISTLDSSAVARVGSYQSFWDALEHPRIYVLDIGIGGSIDRVIDEAYPFMEPGDIVLDPERQLLVRHAPALSPHASSVALLSRHRLDSNAPVASRLSSPATARGSIWRCRRLRRWAAPAAGAAGRRRRPRPISCRWSTRQRAMPRCRRGTRRR